jgi:hypothetical protein
MVGENRHVWSLSLVTHGQFLMRGPSKMVMESEIGHVPVADVWAREGLQAVD